MALRERKARVGAIPEGGMADIAFLLLVFFLVTTTIDMDKGLGIILPAEGQELEINKKNILNCLISSSGSVLLGGEPIAIKDIHRRVKEEIRQNDKLIISVKAHEKSQYNVYVEVLDQLKMANATRVSIAETE
ncbi:MAG: ExbD/TolR family protein [Candidatus Neomarinimicrobiota bacterium]|jgi:biopolymer transport protein ExbD|tara:strand:+ start:2051 stop:2449 length:399 start_codon:yes stop_codon:yes gene_type:complete